MLIFIKSVSTSDTLVEVTLFEIFNFNRGGRREEEEVDAQFSYPSFLEKESVFERDRKIEYIPRTK